jgi:hypothetical protein
LLPLKGGLREVHIPKKCQLARKTLLLPKKHPFAPERHFCSQPIKKATKPDFHHDSGPLVSDPAAAFPFSSLPIKLLRLLLLESTFDF